ncbi:hypothetical protein TWF696_007329 [Orbilia brochopaga]|uniref:C2H2-type domain-containing protein n=1 Tax=Orbilia brochopaga TaxID=3140254 RepID=A0AAV9UUW4_9PEZI
MDRKKLGSRRPPKPCADESPDVGMGDGMGLHFGVPTMIKAVDGPPRKNTSQSSRMDEEIFSDQDPPWLRTGPPSLGPSLHNFGAMKEVSRISSPFELGLKSQPIDNLLIRESSDNPELSPFDDELEPKGHDSHFPSLKLSSSLGAAVNMNYQSYQPTLISNAIISRHMQSSNGLLFPFYNPHKSDTLPQSQTILYDDQPDDQWEECMVKFRTLEHLKRNHFDNQHPNNIREAKTWHQVFDICNPGWKGPRPSQYLDVLEAYQIVLKLRSSHLPASRGITLQSSHGNISEPLEYPGQPQNRERDLIGPSEESGTSSRRPTYATNTDTLHSNYQPYNPTSESTSPSVWHSQTVPAIELPRPNIYRCNFPDSDTEKFPDCTEEIPESLNAVFQEIAAPHLGWRLPPTSSLAYFKWQSIYGLDTRKPTADTYSDLISAMNEPGLPPDRPDWTDPILDPQFPTDGSTSLDWHYTQNSEI